MRFKQAGSVVLGIAAFAAIQAQAQTYPGKPIRVIMTIAAGSPSDVVLRTVSQKLLASLGQSLAIENRPGGDMVIGSEACAKAAPDGYTFCVLPKGAVSINPFIFSKLPYDPEKDLRPVTSLWYLVHGLIMTAKLPVNSAAQLRALETAKPGSLNIGTMGDVGGDVYRRWLNEQWNTNIVGIPYKGANLIMNALIAGEVQLSMMTLGSLGGQVQAGKVKLLAVGSAKRLRQFPDVPTYNEVGFEGFPRTWWGLFAPGATPDAIVKRINSEFVHLFREPKFVEFLENQFLESTVSSPEEFARFLKEDREAAALMVKRYDFPRQ